MSCPGAMISEAIQVAACVEKQPEYDLDELIALQDDLEQSPNHISNPSLHRVSAPSVFSVERINVPDKEVNGPTNKERGQDDRGSKTGDGEGGNKENAQDTDFEPHEDHQQELMSCSDGGVSFHEDHVEQGEELCDENYFKTLMQKSGEELINDSVSDEADPQVDEFLKVMDKSFLPVSEGEVYREGVKKSRTSKFVLLHNRNKLSQAYLQTHADGIIHVLPGWDHDSFISDISYCFHSSHNQSIARVPFLDGMSCRVRTYGCAGVWVCKNCSEEFRNTTHTVVSPRDRNILDAVDAVDPIEEARRKVVGIYKSTVKNWRCPGKKVSGNGIVTSYCGVPRIVRSSRPIGRKYFIGCSGFEQNDGVRHYARSLDLEVPEVQYLKGLFCGEETLRPVDGECTFVQAKRKGKKSCPRHGCKLVHVECKEHAQDKKSWHIMCTYEPIGYNEDIPPEKKVLYVSCRGEHLHPAPPPPETTIKKMRIFEYLCAKKSWSSLAHLRHAIQTALVELKEGNPSNGAISIFDGSVELPLASLRRRLKRLQPPVPKLAVEIGELGLMASDSSLPYVRGMELVGEKVVVFLGHAESFLYTCRRKSFAGDTTFKTVMEATRKIRLGRWYLYNIVCIASCEKLNGKGYVVMRALTTGLTKDAYRAIWKHFLESMIAATNIVNGEAAVDHGCLQVPYIEIPASLVSRSFTVNSITMDFDTAEIHGCAEAVRELGGGSVETHLRNLFIGCEVHLERDLKRHARDRERMRASGMDFNDLLKTYTNFINAETEGDAKTALQKIKSFDPNWVKWAEDKTMVWDH